MSGTTGPFGVPPTDEQGRPLSLQHLAGFTFGPRAQATYTPPPLDPGFRYSANPIGTETVQPPPSLRSSEGLPFTPLRTEKWDPLARRAPTQAEFETMESGSQGADQLAMMMEGGGFGADAARVSAAAKRVRPPGVPPPRVQPGVDVPSAGPTPAAPVRATPALGGGQRGMMAVPSLRDMTPAEASAAAQSEPHLIQKDANDPNSGFIGAPEQIKNRADIEKMRNSYDADVATGAGGRHWYTLARDWITSITGGDMPEARRIAEGLAKFSAQSDPDTNLQFLLQARNAFLRGEPLPLVRTGQQARSYNEAMAAKEAARARGEPEPDMRQGLKTGPFAWHLSPDRPAATTGVHDIWDARAWGYRDPKTGGEFEGSPTAQQHTFMDYETQLAIDRANAAKTGGFSDWDAATVQAAPWVANKEVSLAKRFPKWSPEKVHQKAISSFMEYAPENTAYSVFEQAPGKSTGLYSSYMALSPAEKAQWEAANWAHPVTGRDVLTSGATGNSMFLQSPMQASQGIFRNREGELELNPAQAARLLVDTLAKEEGAPAAPAEIHPGTKAALSGTAAVRGLGDVQEGQAWHYIDTGESQPVKGMTSLRLLGPRPTKEQISQLEKIATAHGFYPIDTADGVTFLNAGEGNAPTNGSELKKRLKAGLQAEIEQALPGTKVVTGSAQSDYFSLADELAESAQGRGRSVEKVLDELKNMQRLAPRWYDDLMDNPYVAVKFGQNRDRMTPDMVARRPDIAKMLDVVRQGGNFRSLVDLVEKTPGRAAALGLPAALIAALAPRSKDQAK
jgi:hypothetical protein